MLDRLAASEERYRVLTIMSPDGISIVDATGRILDCNDQFAQLHGYTTGAELIGRYATDFARLEEFRRLQATVGAAFARGERVARDIRIEAVRRDGSTCITEYSVAPIPWPGIQGGTAYLSSIRDVTKQIDLQKELEERQVRLEEEVHERTSALKAEIAQRVRLEHALRQRVQELSSLQALGQGISFAHPLEEIVRLYLQRLIDLARVETAELLVQRGTGLWRAAASSEFLAEAVFVEPALAERLAHLVIQQGVALVAADEGEQSGEGRGAGLSARSIVALPLRSADAAFGALLVTASGEEGFAEQLPFLEMAADLLAARLYNALLHKEVQERAAGLEESVAERTRELQTERDRTQAILETLGESVVVADQEGVVLFANVATVALTGYSRDEILGQPIWSRWTAPALAQTWPEAQRAVLGGQAWHGEITGRRKDGAVYTAGLTGTPLYDFSGAAAIGSVWVQRDITLLKEAERLKDQFVSNVSHELRTPISIIALTCDNLEAFGTRLSETDRWQMFEEIHDQAHRLTSLAEDILRISQIDNGRVPSARRQLDLAEVLRGEVEGQQAVAQKRSQRLRVDACKCMYVMGNEIQLRQVIRNLLDNAIKYTPSGGQISCRCQVQDGTATMSGNGRTVTAKAWAVIEVQDNGIGIAPGELQHIFERFYRVNNEMDIPGTGLGLPIAQELVAQHGGWISVASTPGLGSTFAVYLPGCEQETDVPGFQESGGAGEKA